MIKNYFKIAFRNLWKTKGYSFLNISGLAIGITCASLIFLWIENEMTYNDHFANKAAIYEVKSKQTYGEKTFVFGATPGKLAEAIKAEIPEIANATRVSDGVSRLFSQEDKNLYQTGGYVDPAFIQIFSLHFLEGDAKMALQDIHSLVISAAMSRRLFGNEKAVGKLLKIDNDEVYTVAAVVDDMPTNSSIQFDWLIPFKNHERTNESFQSWGNNVTRTYVLLKPTADLAKANTKLHDFIAKKTNDDHPTASNFLYPMSRWRLYNSFKDGFEQEGIIKNVRLFSIIAWVILIIACINFMNLATARSEKRAREVGVRKVVGAEKKTLIRQFLGESILLASISAIVALALCYLFIRPFNVLVEKDLSINILYTNHLLFLIAIVLVCGLISGSYPAFYLSSFNPISVLKGTKLKTGTATFIRRGLVIVQFAASITLIICTLIIFQQIQYVKNRDLGFDRSQIITTSIQGKIGPHIDTFKEQLKATGAIEHVGSSYLNILSIYFNSGGFSWDGKDPNANTLIGINLIDEDLFPALGMHIADGRNFHHRLLGDSTNVIINQAFAKLIQQDGAVVGDILTWDNTAYTIVGVLQDFVYNNMYSPSEPLVFLAAKPEEGTLYIKTKERTALPEAIAKIEKVMKTHNPGYPFEYHFLDEDFENKFKSESMIQKLAGVFAVLSISISCIGLFGLAAFMTERRKKEIGIRKVLGATIPSLANLLSKEFAVLVVLSCLIAFPLAYWFMHNWLGNYQYRTGIHWWVFALSGLGALMIALFTVSSQTIKTALLNPTKTLRDE